MELTPIQYLGEIGIKQIGNNIADKINKTEKGAANGVASLGSNGKVPSSQLPSTIDVLSADPTSPAVGYIWITTS